MTTVTINILIIVKEEIDAILYRTSERKALIIVGKC